MSDQDGAIDWAQLHRRVESIGVALGGAQRRSERETAEALMERARRLAAATESARAAGAERPLVTFQIAGELLAVEARHVLEIARIPSWAPYPGAAPPLAGVGTWRGGLLTLYQIGSALGLATPSPGEDAWALVMGHGPAVFGVLVDAPGEFLLVPDSDLGAPADAAGPSTQWVRTFTTDGLPVLDDESLLRLHH